MPSRFSDSITLPPRPAQRPYAIQFTRLRQLLDRLSDQLEIDGVRVRSCRAGAVEQLAPVPAHFGPELDQIDLPRLPSLSGVGEKDAVFLIDVMDGFLAKDVDPRSEELFAARHFHDVGDEALGDLMLDDSLVDFTDADHRLQSGIEKVLLDRHVDREPDADISRDGKEDVVPDSLHEIEQCPQDL